MDQRNEIMKFSNINLVEYLNKTHKTVDNFLIETQKHNLKKYMKTLNSELYKSFISNSDSLLNILDTYAFCYGILNNFQVPKTTHEDEEPNINTLKCKELDRKFNRFEDDMSPFLTGKRFLVTSEYFNDKKYYLILSNDILFIGELKDEKSKKYILKHSFNKNVIKMKKHKKSIEIIVEGIKYDLTADKELIDEFYELYTETAFEMKNAEDTKKTANKELIKYFIVTEQMEKLVKYLEKFEKVELNMAEVKLFNKGELKMLLNVSKFPEKIFSSFIDASFTENLNKINKIQTLNALINEIFDYLEEFVSSLEQLYDDLSIPLFSLPLNIESFIYQIFQSLEKRVFNKFYKLKITNENLELIKKRLIFKQYDYSYMFNKILERKSQFGAKCMEITREEIKELLNKYLL
ncbi:hypothetical protein NUSPORA_00572 [Nucleospora cyclopteri]